MVLSSRSSQPLAAAGKQTEGNQTQQGGEIPIAEHETAAMLENRCGSTAEEQTPTSTDCVKSSVKRKYHLERPHNRQTLTILGKVLVHFLQRLSQLVNLPSPSTQIVVSQTGTGSGEIADGRRGSTQLEQRQASRVETEPRATTTHRNGAKHNPNRSNSNTPRQPQRSAKKDNKRDTNEADSNKDREAKSGEPTGPPTISQISSIGNPPYSSSSSPPS